MLAAPGSERVFIAYLIQNPKEFYKYSSKVTRDFFLADANKVLFDVIQHAVTKEGIEKLDVLTIDAIGEKIGFGHIKKYVSPEHIKTLMSTQVDRRTIPSILENIRKNYCIVSLRDNLKATVNKIDNLSRSNTELDSKEILSLVQTSIMKTAQALMQTEDIDRLGKDIDAYIKSTMEIGEEAHIIETNLPKWNDGLGRGLRKGGVNVIAARPKTGKSTFIDYLLKYFALDKQIPTLLLDTEMDKDFHRTLMLSQITNIPRLDVETGAWANNSDTERKIKEASVKIEESPIYYKNISGLSIEEVTVFIKEFIHRYVGLDDSGKAKDCMIAYDFLHLDNIRRISKNVQEYQVLGHFFKSLREIASAYKVPILLAIQQNRGGIDEDYGTAAGSDRIEWFCWSMTILRKKTPQEIARDGRENGNVKARISYSRTGPGHDIDDYLNLNMDYATGNIEEGKTAKELWMERKNQDDGEDDLDEGKDKKRKRGRRKKDERGL